MTPAMDLPSEPVLRSIIQRVANLEARLGSEIGRRPLVLPTPEFFPDRFVGDRASVERLILRMQEHAAMSDIPIALAEEDDHGEPTPHEKSASHSCGTGGCGSPDETETPRLVDAGEGGWRVHVPPAETGHHVALTTNLARILAMAFLEETRNEDEPLEPPVEVTTDLTATALGFGVLLLQGSHIYQKSCGGPSVGKLTALRPEELAVAVALRARLGGHSLKPALKLLELTQREALAEADAFVQSNDALVALLRTKPEAVALGAFELSETKSLLQRLWRKKSAEPAASWNQISADASLDDLEGAIALGGAPFGQTASTGRSARKAEAKPRSAADEELRRLVAEELDSHGVR